MHLAQLKCKLSQASARHPKFTHCLFIYTNQSKKDVIDGAELSIDVKIKMMNDLTIQEVSDRLELPKSTLRYWEKELEDHIKPNRTPGGQRRYDKGHIAFFERVRAMKNSGLTLSKIKRALACPPPDDKTPMDPSGDASIDLLAQRIADLVKREVSIFLSNDRQ
jgi:DNA-binding transcriptional MerR regulator